MISFRTNLDYITVPNYNSDIMPPLGASVVCKTKGFGFKNVTLQVHGPSFRDGRWEVELHTPSWHDISLREWNETYVGITI